MIVCMYVCVCVYIYTYIHPYIYIYIWYDTYIICIYSYTHTHTGNNDMGNYHFLHVNNNFLYPRRKSRANAQQLFPNKGKTKTTDTAATVDRETTDTAATLEEGGFILWRRGDLFYNKYCS